METIQFLLDSHAGLDRELIAIAAIWLVLRNSPRRNRNSTFCVLIEALATIKLYFDPAATASWNRKRPDLAFCAPINQTYCHTLLGHHSPLRTIAVGENMV